ncbi:hypothetical protein [Ruminococcus sp. NK3A76]|uniref:hypothetical protein n=1 Tax=Ruminococcus sp. NK3A76 TaxID=877411 RepID=UPI00049037D1|nr:hypothetical protein [Ruminococcus sp. NK3A76]
MKKNVIIVCSIIVLAAAVFFGYRYFDTKYVMTDISYITPTTSTKYDNVKERIENHYENKEFRIKDNTLVGFDEDIPLDDNMEYAFSDSNDKIKEELTIVGTKYTFGLATVEVDDDKVYVSFAGGDEEGSVFLVYKLVLSKKEFSFFE